MGHPVYVRVLVCACVHVISNGECVYRYVVRVGVVPCCDTIILYAVRVVVRPNDPYTYILQSAQNYKYILCIPHVTGRCRYSRRRDGDPGRRLSFSFLFPFYFFFIFLFLLDLQFTFFNKYSRYFQRRRR